MAGLGQRGVLNPAVPALDEVCKELNGWVLEDVKDEKGNVVAKAGQQLSKFLDTRADGSTLSGNWLYIGMYTDAGNLTTLTSHPLTASSSRWVIARAASVVRLLTCNF